MAKAEKTEEKSVEKKERKPSVLPPLSEGGAKQFAAIQAKGTALIADMGASEVNERHLRLFVRQFGEAFRNGLKAKHGDAASRKKARLQSRLAKIQAEIAALNAEKATAAAPATK